MRYQLVVVTTHPYFVTSVVLRALTFSCVSFLSFAPKVEGAATPGETRHSKEIEQPRASDADPMKNSNTCQSTASDVREKMPAVELVEYEDERQLDDIMSLVDRDLSEPYSIFTYRYFLHNWPNLCFVVSCGNTLHLVCP